MLAYIMEPTIDLYSSGSQRGRLGIFELLVLDGSMREMIFRGESTLRLREHARNSAGMRTLNEDGVSKVLEGTTSIDELLRVTASR